MNSFIFTDIHGCLDELTDLWHKAGVTVNDEVIIAGDMVDRGPASADVVTFLHRKSLIQRVVPVMGNHDHKHSRYRKALVANPKTARDMARRKPEMADISNAMSEGAAHFMDSSAFSYTDSLGRFSVVHGGVTPRTRSLPHQPPYTKEDTVIMYVRYLSPDGVMRRLGEEAVGDKFWAEVYDGRFGHIIFGHQPFMDSELPVEFPHATGLDLGCCFGGHLACIRFDEHGNRTTFTVKARKAYSDRHH